MRSKGLFPSARSPVVRITVLSACVLGAATAVVIAEQITVQRPQAEVLDAKGSAGDVIEIIPKAGTLEVLGPREGPWIHVRTPSGKVGYIAGAVADAGSDGPDLSGVTGTHASGSGATAAGRGWDPEVETYVSSNKLNRKGLEQMEANRRQYRGKPMKEFEKAGKLAGAN